jgi:hypothetical protein
MNFCAIFLLTVCKEVYKGAGYAHAILLTPLDDGGWVRRCDSNPHVRGVRFYRKWPVRVQFAVFSAKN